jgi:hypothetical protein
MFKNKKLLLYFFIITYLSVGIYLSLTNGITSDESFEQFNWDENTSGIKSLLKFGHYDEFLRYLDKYHGIAFHYISQPVQFLTSGFVSNLNQVSDYGAHLMSKHSMVFLIFFISSFYFYRLIHKITDNSFFSLLSTSLYLLYPYLFGHSQFNMKDIPFLSIWLITTYYFLVIIEDIYFEKKLQYTKLILVAFLAAYLISIRILGVLIFLQSLISIIILFNIKNIRLITFIKNYYKDFSLFIFLLLFFIYLMNPILWLNPYEFINSIKWMSNYFNNICTLTLGDCMNSLSLPSSYYFIWLFFKLPILIIFGVMVFPFVEKKIFKDDLNSIYYGTYCFSFLSIIFLFILLRVNIYDEIRHIMFILPLIFLVGLINLYFINKKISYILSIFTIIFFIFENISLNPYQYTWLNSFAKFTKIEKNFEVDYWGVSGKNLSKKIVEYTKEKNLSKEICIYGDAFTEDYLIKHGFSCFKRYQQLDSAKIKPVLAYKNLRNTKRSNPRDCELIWDETYKYLFYNKKISVGTVWRCD